MKLLLAAAAAALVLIASSSGGGGGPSPLSFHLASQNHQNPVEQESPNFFYVCGNNPTAPPPCDPSTWVTNPTACDWDVDDMTVLQGFGDLAAGASGAGSMCMVADGVCCFGGDPHRFEVSVAADVATLNVRLTSSQGFSASATVAPEGHGFRYLVCARDPAAPPFQTIPDSNGGTGRVDTWTVSISNPSTHTVRGIYAMLQTGFTGPFASLCYTGPS